MTKKIRLSLDDLKVQSFVTALGNEGHTLLGGSQDTEPPICDTDGYTCNFKCGETEYWECDTPNGGNCSANCYTPNGGNTCNAFCTWPNCSAVCTAGYDC